MKIGNILRGQGDNSGNNTSSNNQITQSQSSNTQVTEQQSQGLQSSSNSSVSGNSKFNTASILGKRKRSYSTYSRRCYT